MDTSFFFNDTATTEIYTLSLHDALPICAADRVERVPRPLAAAPPRGHARRRAPRPPQRLRPRRHARGGLPLPVHRQALTDRKSTRLNSSHANISYAVFCLKKKNNHTYFN